MATASYLEAAAGGMVTGAAFDGDDAALKAIALLRDSGVREQDVTVLAADRRRAALVAGDRAWTAFKKWGRLRSLPAKLMPGGGTPKEVRQRYANALKAGKIVVIAAAGGQPSDTIAALLAQSRGEAVEQWWQSPCFLFAPPELAGPF
jgi:hypothetical protein